MICHCFENHLFALVCPVTHSKILSWSVHRKYVYFHTKTLTAFYAMLSIHYGRVAERLEHLPNFPKTTVRDPPRTNGWKLSHCPSSSKWGPCGNTGEIKAARKGTGHSTSQCWWPRTSVLSNRHSPAYGSYMGHTFAFIMYNTVL